MGKKETNVSFWRGRWTLWVETHEENLICCMSDSHRFTRWMRKMSVSRSGKISTYPRLCPPNCTAKQTSPTFLWSLKAMNLLNFAFKDVCTTKKNALRGGAIHSCVGMFRLVFHRPPQISLLLSEVTYPFFRGEESHQSLGSELFHRWGKRNLATSRGVLEELEFFFWMTMVWPDVVVSTSEILLVI